jgi:hypothetical protein
MFLSYSRWVSQTVHKYLSNRTEVCVQISQTTMLVCVLQIKHNLNKSFALYKVYHHMIFHNSPKGKPPTHGPGQTLGATEGWGSQASKLSAHERGKFVSPAHRPPLPLSRQPLHLFLLEIIRPQAYSVAERIMSVKNLTDLHNCVPQLSGIL